MHVRASDGRERSVRPSRSDAKSDALRPQSGAKSVTAPDRPGSHRFVRPSRNPPNAAWLCRSVRANTTTCVLLQWAERDSNPRRHKPADLQSALVGHLSIRPMGCRPGRRARLAWAFGGPRGERDCSRVPAAPKGLGTAGYPADAIVGKPPTGLEPATSRLQITCSAN